MSAEVSVLVPPFAVTSLIAVALYALAREKLGWDLLSSLLLSVSVSTLVGALAYALTVANARLSAVLNRVNADSTRPDIVQTP